MTIAKYLLHGKLNVLPGERDRLSEILSKSANIAAQTDGCQLYAISVDENDPNAVFLTEIWEQESAHQTFLANAEVIALMAAAIPLLAIPSAKGQTLHPIAGFGITRVN